LNDSKFLLSLFNVSRGLLPTKREDEKILPDFSTVSNPSKSKRRKRYIIPSWFMIDWIQKNNLGLDLPKWRKSDLYLSMKEGPQGKSSASSFHTIDVIYRFHQDVLSKIRKLFELTKSDFSIIEKNYEMIENG
jgi:hypothetical protein